MADETQPASNLSGVAPLPASPETVVERLHDVAARMFKHGPMHPASVPPRASGTTYKVQCQHCSRLTHISDLLTADLTALHAEIARLRATERIDQSVIAALCDRVAFVASLPSAPAPVPDREVTP